MVNSIVESSTWVYDENWLVMNMFFSKNLSGFTTVTLVTVVLVSIIGMSYSMGMGLSPNGNMDNCLLMMFMGKGICNMTFSQHLSLWQEIVAATQQKAFSFNALIFLVISLAFLLAAITQQLSVITSRDFAYKFYTKQKPYRSFFDYLKEAFSGGILKPKIYNLAF
jgi:hypothetical protein